VSEQRQVIAPPRDGSRVMAVGVAVILLVAGIVVLASAFGLFSGKRDGNARFKPPGQPTYVGPLRADNGPNISIPQALVPPAIDGDVSDWEGAIPGPFEAPNITYQKGRAPSGPDDLSANFYFAWDADNFYVAAIVSDNVHVQNSRTRGYELYKGDDIEIWFDTDLAGDFAVREANGDDFQLGLSPGDFGGLAPEVVFWNPDKSTARNKMVEVAALPGPGKNGYTLEAAVPWAALGAFRPQPGMAIGFAASAGDNDQVNTPIQELMVSTAPTLQYRQPLSFGNLFF
jgi:Carbohydrate family 9 binding domain-like